MILIEDRRVSAYPLGVACLVRVTLMRLTTHHGNPPTCVSPYVWLRLIAIRPTTGSARPEATVALAFHRHATYHAALDSIRYCLMSAPHTHIRFLCVSFRLNSSVTLPFVSYAETQAVSLASHCVAYLESLRVICASQTLRRIAATSTVPTLPKRF